MLLKRSISLLTPFPRAKVNLYHLIRHNFASSSKSFYQVLNVSQSASRNEIKTAYYKLAKLYHPDVSKGNEERFKEISSAYDTLSDDGKRKQYDETLKYSSSSSNTSYSSSQQSSYGGHNSYNAYNNKQQQQQQQYQQQWNQNYQQRSHTNYEYDPEYDDPRYSQSYREQYTNQRSQQHQQYDPFSWDFRRRFYEDFESAQAKDYAAYEKAEEERMHQAEKEFEEALHQAMTDVRRKLITIIVACISLILLFKIAFGGRKRLVQEHVVYDQKNGALYVTDEKTYHQWVKSFQPDNYPFEKDPRFVRQNINFRQPTVPPYNPNYPSHPNQPRPVWDNNRVRDERNGLAAVPPPPQNHQNPQNQQSQQ